MIKLFGASFFIHIFLLAMLYFCPPGVKVGLLQGDLLTIETIYQSPNPESQQPHELGHSFISQDKPSKTLPAPTKKVLNEAQTQNKNFRKTLLTSSNPQKVGFDLRNVTSNLSPAMKSFFFQLRMDIERNKTYPQKAKRFRQSGQVQVAFEIDSLGNILNIRIEKKSPYTTLNRSAIDLLATLQTKKYPLPSEVEKSGISVVLPINYNL